MEAITAGERETTYGFLAALLLKPPTDSFVAMIKDGSILPVAADSPSYSEFAEFVKDAGKMTDLKEELEAEHTALFVLPSGVLPHEAAYLDREKRLGGRITVSVRQFYERAGMETSEACIEVPDHLGLELEFMGFLCRLEKKFREKQDRSSLLKCIEFQKAFLDEHLLKWAHQCCEKVIEKSAYGFYKAIAHFTKEFIKDEEKYVRELYIKSCKEGEGICEPVA
ncbi:MAG: hypothetical protein C4526_08700 [Nitrospiraceae bacterium]|nr:MAG: hypothetical protein C4526_08700 [Nitrospiraceae bacterium]